VATVTGETITALQQTYDKKCGLSAYENKYKNGKILCSVSIQWGIQTAGISFEKHGS
jgi:hypothetical protein